MLGSEEFDSAFPDEFADMTDSDRVSCAVLYFSGVMSGIQWPPFPSVNLKKWPFET